MLPSGPSHISKDCTGIHNRSPEASEPWACGPREDTGHWALRPTQEDSPGPWLLPTSQQGVSRAWHILVLWAHSEHWISQDPSVPQALLPPRAGGGHAGGKGSFPAGVRSHLRRLARRARAGMQKARWHPVPAPTWTPPAPAPSVTAVPEGRGGKINPSLNGRI